MKTKIKESIKVPIKSTKNCNWIADNNHKLEQQKRYGRLLKSKKAYIETATVSKFNIN